jgi:hypothetical protein
MRSISSLLGFAFFFFMVVGYCLLAAVPITSLNPYPLFVLFGGIFGSALLAFGYKDFDKALSSTRYFFFTPQTPVDTGKAIRVLSFMIVSCYAQGALIFVIEILSLIRMASVESIAEVSRLQSINMAIGSLLAPLVISEAFLRPLKARLETLAGK